MPMNHQTPDSTRPQPSMYEGTGRCTDCGAAVGMRHDADCPNYPQPDAAQGQTINWTRRCDNAACAQHGQVHDGACRPQPDADALREDG